MTAVLRRAPRGRPAGRPVRVRPRRPDLPDLGADLRLQPRVRALPVLLRPARPARAVHRRGRARSSTSCSGCRSSTSTSAAASPTVRPDFWHLLDYAIGHDVGVKFSTNGIKLDKAARRSSWPRTDYVDVQISLDGATAEVNDAVRGAGLLRHRDPRPGEPGRGRHEGRQDLRRRHPPERRPARRVQGAHRPLRRPAAASPGCARPAAAPTSGTSCTRPQAQQRELYDWLLANGERRAHRRLVLPPVGVRRGPARAEPLRRRARRLPDRPGRRRLRLPVRDPRELPGRQRPRRRAASQRVWQSLASCSPTCAARRPAAPARSAPTSTPAAAAAWRPSSSPACRSTGPTPSASRATARRRWPRATLELVDPAQPPRPLAHRPGPRPADAARASRPCRRRRSATSRRSPGSTCAEAHRPADPGGADGALAGAVRPARDQPGARPRPVRPARRLLRTAGRRRCRDRRHRDRVGARRRPALRARPAGRRLPRRLDGDRRRLPPVRHARARLARSRRRSGVVGLVAAAAVGAVAAWPTSAPASCPWRWSSRRSTRWWPASRRRPGSPSPRTSTASRSMPARARCCASSRRG